ncbi:S1C family serine protease [Aestuariivivens insulae]|uniref:S1C family serine protease n=1 Tax=Aestuariivivens insulae TaxID=1621988 RepID=UPI001F567823|nr:trypsin-like peptidase domain-containing protein [Aestuariivivens insulae]
MKYKYTDSTNTIFKSKSNSSYLSAKISKLDIQLVHQRAARTTMAFVKADVGIEWSFLDFYGQNLYKRKFDAVSGEFSIDYNKKETATMAVNDAISKSFLNFINDQKVQDFLSKESNVIAPKMEVIELSKGNAVSNLEDAIKAALTVKVKEGHGSGFVVSNDGYLITNFHVVANSKDEITVLTKEGKSLNAKLIRQNEDLDLALLKVDNTFEKHFNLPDKKNYSMGDDIFVIGTPKSIELGNTMSKGIISGDREREGIKLIQTDASINGGNSGGPMISKKGEVLGVVNAKLSGFGIEGLGFAIPADLISEALSLK